MKKTLTIIFFFLTLSGITLLLGLNSSTVLAATASGQVFQTDTCPAVPGTSPHHSFTIRLPWTIPSGSTCPPTGCNGYTDTSSDANSGAFTLTVPSGVTPGSQISIVGEPGWQFPCVTNQPVSSSVVFGVKPISTSGGSGLTGTTIYPDLIVDNLSPANGSQIPAGTVTFSGVVKNIASTPQSGNPPIANPSQALLFIDYNLDNILDFPPGFTLSNLTNTNYSYFKALDSIGPTGIRTASWSSLLNPPGIHGFAICANMHVNSSGARDVIESNYNNNCTFGYFVANTNPFLNDPANSCFGTQPVVNLSWTPPGYFVYLRDSYLVFRDQNDGNWQLIGSNLIENFVDNTASAGTTYRYRIAAVNPLGLLWSNIAPTLVSPTPSCNPPTITSLEITQGGSTSFSGTSRVSGNQSAPDQGGSDWLNPINITLNAREGSKPITQYYVAFYKKDSSGLVTTPSSCATNFDENTCLPDLKNRVSDDHHNGFLLKYDTSGNYYLWDGAWVNINGRVNDGQPIFGGGQLLLKAYPKQPDQTVPNSWKLLFFKDFGSKDMYTAGYVVDENRLSAFSPDL